jgi:hypothetical protein
VTTAEILAERAATERAERRALALQRGLVPDATEAERLAYYAMRGEQDRAKRRAQLAATDEARDQAMRASQEYHLTTRPMTLEEERLGPSEALRRRVEALG